jgi:hypothetical protein
MKLDKQCRVNYLCNVVKVILQYMQTSLNIFQRGLIKINYAICIQ